MSEPNQTWRSFSRLCTLFIPNEWLMWAGETDEQKQAWREKVALCVIMLVANASFLGFGGLISTFSCANEDQSFDLTIESLMKSLSDSVNHENPTCRALNITTIGIMFVVFAILLIQCICSILYLVRFGRTYCKAVRGEQFQTAKVIVTVPCYNEGEEELKKTIDSVRDESYPKDKKLLLFIADGNIKGKNNDGKDNYDTTPAILSDLLGYKRTGNDPIYSCDSTGYETGDNGEKTPVGNRAKVYHGTTKEGLNYMVIEKCGRPIEGDSGNRGKRDSQIILLQLLNKIQHNQKHRLLPESPRYRGLNELETAIQDCLRKSDFPLKSDQYGERDGLDEVKYLMAVDADTRLGTDSITQMVYSMEAKPRTLALCGETKVENKDDSLVTKLQVFEYYTNHGLKKAFESIFGTVTCLPGCFTMYRLFDARDSNTSPEPLFACDYVYDRYAKNDAVIETLHEKNLYKLGEDRMLTTLLLEKWRQMHLKYVPEAHCYTIVPNKLRVLKSQRRRWINSTFHNILYLMRVDLGGVCCCSMKFVVILDMIGTLILPGSYLYMVIMIYNAIVNHSQVATYTLLVLGFSVFVQLIGPLLRLKFKYLWYAFIYYLVGIPVFYFYLPVYSFWHLDDFSWGATRVIAADDSKKASTVDALDEEQGSCEGDN